MPPKPPKTFALQGNDATIEETGQKCFVKFQNNIQDLKNASASEDRLSLIAIMWRDFWRKMANEQVGNRQKGSAVATQLSLIS